MTSIDRDKGGKEESLRLSVMFSTAELALWAGDAVHAEELLTEILQMSSDQGDSLSEVANPIVASAGHRRRQLRLRRSEFEVLGRSAGLSEKQLEPPDRYLSKAGHLAGIIHAISEREFEFRCYLNDLSWEAQFYRSLTGLSQSRESAINLKLLGYGNSNESMGQEDPKAESSLGLDFYLTPDEVFTQVQVSDFCTFQARSMWFKKTPETKEEIVSYFQKLVDQIDG